MSKVMPSDEVRTRLLVRTFLCVLLFGAGARTSATTGGRLSGKVVDEQGNPVPGVELKVVPTGDGVKGDARTLKSGDHGTFLYPFFPPGSYRIQVEDPGRFIKSMSYVLRDGSGLEITRAKADAHPDKGLPPFQLGVAQRAELEIVLAPRNLQEEMSRKLALSEASGDLKRINDLFTVGDMAGAVSSADALIAQKPQIASAHYLRGMALSRLGRLDEAETALREALRLAPDQAGLEGALGTTLLLRGQALAKSGRADEAKPLFGEAVKLLTRELERAPDSLPLLRNHAAALEAASDREGLAADLTRLMAAEPANAEYPLRLAALQIETGHPDQASETLSRAPKTDKGGASLAYSIAARFFNEGKVPQAIESARLGLGFDESSAPLYRLLGRAYASQGKNAEAIEAINKLLSLAPNDPQADADQELLQHLQKAKP